MKTVQIALTLEQADLVKTAIQAEVKRGHGTFLSDDAVCDLLAVALDLNNTIESYFLAVEAQ